MTATEGDWEALAKLVRQRRFELAIRTQHEAAERSDVSKNTWQRLENGQPVGRSTLLRVAAVLNWSPAYIQAVLREGENAPIVGAEGETVIARPKTVEAKVRIPSAQPAAIVTAPARPEASVHIAAPNVTAGMNAPLPALEGQASGGVVYPSVVPISKDMGIISIPIPVPLDIADDLTEEDTRLLFHMIQQQGTAFLEAVVSAKRAERARQGFETKSEWPDLGVNNGKQGDEPDDES